MGAGACPTPSGWARNRGCIRDTTATVAKGGCSACDTELRWCFVVLSGGLLAVSTAAHCHRQPAKAPCPRQHGQGHLLPQSISPCCLTIPRPGLAVPPCRVLACHGIRAPASPSDNFLSFAASVPGSRAVPAWHDCALVAFTALRFGSDGYLCVPVSFFSWVIPNVYPWKWPPDSS